MARQASAAKKNTAAAESGQQKFREHMEPIGRKGGGERVSRDRAPMSEDRTRKRKAAWPPTPRSPEQVTGQASLPREPQRSDTQPRVTAPKKARPQRATATHGY